MQQPPKARDSPPSTASRETGTLVLSFQELNSACNPSEQETDSPQSLQKGTQPEGILIFIQSDYTTSSNLQNCKRINLGCSKILHLW